MLNNADHIPKEKMVYNVSFLLHLLAAKNVMNWNLMGTGDCNTRLSNLMSAEFISMNFTVLFFFCYWTKTDSRGRERNRGVYIEHWYGSRLRKGFNRDFITHSELNFVILRGFPAAVCKNYANIFPAND